MNKSFFLSFLLISSFLTLTLQQDPTQGFLPSQFPQSPITQPTPIPDPTAITNPAEIGTLDPTASPNLAEIGTPDPTATILAQTGTSGGISVAAVSGCKTNKDCPAGRTCQSGQCVGCVTRSSCTSGLICVSGNCITRPICAPGVDNTICAEVPCGICSGDAYCENGSYCNANRQCQLF